MEVVAFDVDGEAHMGELIPGDGATRAVLDRRKSPSVMRVMDADDFTIASDQQKTLYLMQINPKWTG